MKHLLPLSVSVPLFLCSLALPGGELRFAVPEKTVLAKVFDAKVAFHSTGITMQVDGKEVDTGIGGLKVHLEESTHVELHDVYGASKSGKPASVKRSFDKLSGKSAQHFELPKAAQGRGPANVDHALASELEGKTVVFTLGDDGEYKSAFADDKGEADLLTTLEEDMDLRGLLPDGAVEEDKSWTIDAQAFHSVLNLPGGDLKLKAEEDKEHDNKLNQQLQENAKGKAKGTYKGLREVDGHKYAVVALEAELESTGERENPAKDGAAGTTELKVGYSVEGELLWDAEAGHFQSCKLTSKVTLTVKDTINVEQGGEKHELVRTTEFEGESEFSAALGG